MNKYTYIFKMLLLSVVGILLVSCQESDEPKAKYGRKNKKYNPTKQKVQFETW